MPPAVRMHVPGTRHRRLIIPGLAVTLDRDDRLQGVDDLDQVRLPADHRLDVLVSRWGLINVAHRGFGPGAFKRPGELGFADRLFGGFPPHAATGAVRARFQAVFIAHAAHDVAAGAHTAGDYAELAVVGAGSALSLIHISEPTRPY